MASRGSRRARRYYSAQMIHLFVNALAASAGGGLTYIRNVASHLASVRDVRVTILLTPQFRRQLGNWDNISLIEWANETGTARRFWREQWQLPALIRRSGADVLISAGNFALWKSPVPQILLSRNSLYVSTDFQRDLRARGDYLLWLDTNFKGALARASIGCADLTVAPSAAFAQKLAEWAGTDVAGIHHGFDRQIFFGNHSSLPEPIQHKLDEAEDTLRLLFVSHYNYYRNFETLIQALILLKRQLFPRRVTLVLTCKLSSNENPGSYRADSVAALVQQSGLSKDVIELGTVPYHLLHRVYGQCDIYVSPAYAETFAHPLVEAMASSLPVVASDLPVHREICRDAALYFPHFSPQSLTDRILQLASSPDLAAELSQKGLARSQDFSWSKHVDELLNLARGLAQA